jgi:hypothetical protein
VPTTGVDRLYLSACIFLMSFGLRVIRYGQRINPKEN